ncbi:TIGR00730 family Rossman fold protein [Cohaesibacter celericrescens]|uniref:Cytokinin riboside 5'-monophosphate phosphoribohydrolase n=1 Tax=Cohaesibacter celericrescens TaxID=2067669 RepID=A0A2N5XR57_9HYPH|nr:TIGR00730 family Rossman fold protein [Cohaesibacter celericrescens]PLW77002.1 TIGR00730 family Rossman fold protein [Cohaesibacter celericrescens]
MKSICVFCGSSWGRRKEYENAAIALSQEIARRGYRLVYGGSSVGLMGACADAALAAGGEVVGILPHSLKRKEIDHAGLTELHVVDSMHERKAKMVEVSDGFISLPGGAGTMDEMFEVWTWAMLGWHNKPSALMNVEGYYDDLIRFLDKTSQEDFVKQPHRDMLIVDTDASSLLDQMEAYKAPENIAKWIQKESQM